LLVLALAIGGARAADVGETLALCQDEDAKSSARMAACTAIIENASISENLRAEALLNRALTHMDADAYDKAIVDLDQAIPLNPDYRVLHYTRGLAHQRSGTYAKALADLTTAHTLDPTDADVLEARARTYLLSGEPKLAIKDFDSAIKLDANDPDYFAGRGLAHERIGDTPAAMADYRRALRLDPSHEEATDGLKRLRDRA
jgi:tetratricopeptide (TPR) repeat protein